MARGGRRDGAGRKSTWNHPETQTIRVPKIFVTQVLEYAKQLDSASAALPGKDPHEIADQSLEQMSLFEPDGSVLPYEFVSKSKLTPLRGIELAKRLKVNRGVPSKMKGKYKSNPQKFLEWSKARDPDGIAWEFNSATGFYHPVYDTYEDF